MTVQQLADDVLERDLAALTGITDQQELQDLSNRLCTFIARRIRDITGGEGNTVVVRVDENVRLVRVEVYGVERDDLTVLVRGLPPIEDDDTVRTRGTPITVPAECRIGPKPARADKKRRWFRWKSES